MKGNLFCREQAKYALDYVDPKRDPAATPSIFYTRYH